MIHTLHRVTVFSIVGPYRLRVGFRDGLVREIDFTPVLGGSLFGPLRDETLFNRVRLDPEVHTLVWPNGADFDPATLHDWPEMSPALEERARTWAMNDPGTRSANGTDERPVSEAAEASNNWSEGKGSKSVR